MRSLIAREDWRTAIKNVHYDLIPLGLHRHPGCFSCALRGRRWSWKFINIILRSDISQYTRIRARYITDPRHIARIVEYSPHFARRINKCNMTQKIANIISRRSHNALRLIPKQFMTHEIALRIVTKNNVAIRRLEPQFLTPEVIRIAIDGFTGIPPFMVSKKFIEAIVELYPSLFCSEQNEKAKKKYKGIISLDCYIIGLNKLGGTIKYKVIDCM